MKVQVENINKLEVKTMENQLLVECSQNMRSPKATYRSLYESDKPRRRRRAHFIKIRIRIPDEPKVTNFLRFLFLLPTPILFARIILRFVKLDEQNQSIPLSKKEMIDLISVKGVSVEVFARDGVVVHIKTI